MPYRLLQRALYEHLLSSEELMHSLNCACWGGSGTGTEEFRPTQKRKAAQRTFAQQEKVAEAFDKQDKASQVIIEGLFEHSP